ncbi:MAG: DUF1343 domain-containing protein [bacterium]|nr:DUF1343 domain-containing protein [bacterium]
MLPNIRSAALPGPGPTPGIPSRLIPVSLLSLLLMLPACCTTSEIGLDQAGRPVRTILGIEKRAEGRITLYDLPSSCWPDAPDRGDHGDGELLPTRSEDPLFSGLDAVSIDHFALLKNRRFALLTNATGLDRNLDRGLELMLEAGVRPELVFEPEHGLYGYLDEPGPDGFQRDRKHGLRVLSLYSKRRKPAPEHLAGIDLIVVDIANLPVRCYTYVSTLTYLMEAAEENGIELLIFDRPNPYGFWQAQGSFLQEGYTSFVSEAPVPFLYSMTPGEYANYMADLRFHDLKLSVVQVAGYRRVEIDAPLRKSWINPSPNIPSLESALVYPGMVFFEAVPFSLGRGTTRPFVYSGAPWLEAELIVEGLRELNLPGVEISEVSFRPTASVYKNQTCLGVQLTPVSSRFDPLRTGYEYMRLVRKLHPDRFRLRKDRQGRHFIDKLWGGPAYREAIEADIPYDRFRRTWFREAEIFEEIVERYRLY